MSDTECARCGHELSKHCKGKVAHTNYKEDSRMVPAEWRTMTVVCVGRHCLNPMCSCVDFQEKKA